MSSKKVDVLARLFDTIISHANEDPSKSYTAKLISEGKSKCIEKLKEEIENLKAELAREKEDRQYDNLVHKKELKELYKKK